MANAASRLVDTGICAGLPGFGTACDRDAGAHGERISHHARGLGWRGAILLGRGAMAAGSSLGTLFLVRSGVLQTITLSLRAVIASYAFMALAEQVKRTAQRPRISKT